LPLLVRALSGDVQLQLQNGLKGISLVAYHLLILFRRWRIRPIA